MKIRDRFLFNSSTPNKEHTYAVYYDRKNKEYRAVQLTHLYLKDEERFKKLNKGLFLKEKFKRFEVPSGVRNYYYSKDVSGNNFMPEKVAAYDIDKKHLPKAQSDRIKKFVKKSSEEVLLDIRKLEKSKSDNKSKNKSGKKKF
jgi:hypothetical protein